LERDHRFPELSGARGGSAGVSKFQDHEVLPGLVQCLERLRRQRVRSQGICQIGWDGGIALRLVGGGPSAVGLRGLDLGQAGEQSCA